MEFTMKKTVLFLGLASLIYATPVFAASKPMTHMMSKPVAMCMVHGKKIHCAMCRINGKRVYWVHGKKIHCMLPVKHHAKHHVMHPAAPMTPAAPPKKKY